MRKIMLFLWLILLLSQSCYDNRLDVGSNDMMPFIPFGIEDARQYFENNARDLSPLSFEETSETKSLDRTVTNLYPKWDNAMLSGHRGVSLIEVPLGSATVAFAREYTVWEGSVVGSRETVSGRRLVIAKRSDGEVDMFVITIVPNVSATQSEMVRMVDEFRYLGGGTFSGKVFCSTLEGQFVKALGYTDGELNGTLPTRVRNNTESVDSVESYTRVTFSEEAVAKAGMFSSIEGGGDGGGIDYGRCSHGYTKGFCPYGCDAEIGGVDIVVCPDCHMQNGCVCPKCFYCGKKEKKCTCTRCTRCKKKMPQCTCYLYPDPDKPVTPGGGGGGNDGNENGKNESLIPDPCDGLVFGGIMAKILVHEGGFVNNPADNGKATNKGIAWATWQTYAEKILKVEPTLENLKNLTQKQAIAIYEAAFWKKARIDEINDPDMRYAFFDFYVNAGGYATKVLQKTLNELQSKVSLAVDGAIGPKTIACLNSIDHAILYNTFLEKRQEYYIDLVKRKPNQEIFLRGWLNRVHNFKIKTKTKMYNVNC